MRKLRNIARYSLGLALGALTTVTMLALGRVASARSPIVTPSRTAATALTTLHENGKIAFTSDRDGNQEIYLMNADGTNQTRLTNNSIVDDHAMWSPDGKKLAFVSQRAAGSFAIFQMNIDGSNRVEITPLSNFVNEPPWGVTGFSMSWSPDGRKITYQDGVGGPFPGYHDIFVIDLETHIRQNLTNDGGGSGFCDLCDYHPAWSPDGSTILFSSPRDVDPCTTLYAINPDGTNRRRLSGNHCPAYSPSWSPDGMQIVFVQLNGEFVESELRVANSDGTNVRIFDGDYPDPNNRDYPRWSPDGRKIAFNMAVNFQDIEIYVKNIDGTGYAQLTNTPAGLNYRPSWQPLLPTACPNPIDCNEFFVRQHYSDFLNRQPDPDGLAFWIHEIEMCGADQSCIDAKRVNASAAFFLSIEFQETGYLVYRMYKSAYGNLAAAPVPLTLSEFLPDTQKIGQGVIVNQAGWEQLLENNKQAFMAEFVQRSRFSSAYPTSLTPDQFVDQLFLNAGVAPSATDRAAAINEFGSATTTTDLAARARALRRVAENSTLAQQEFNRAFVLMQYFGYLHRNPNDPPELTLDFQGYNFWLSKLNQFNGDYIAAEMVKAFLVSSEYRHRFGA